MWVADAGRGEQDLDRVLTALAARRRRRILQVLEGVVTPLDETTLARRLTAPPDGPTGPAATDPDQRARRTELRHVHLPKLAEPPLIDWDVADETVSLADHPATDTEAIWRLTGVDAGLDPVLSCLADRRRRSLLEVLDSSGGSLHRAHLAGRLVERTARDRAAGGFERTLRSLHHEHLPALADAGLVRVDGATVVRTGDRRLDLVRAFLEEFRDCANR